MGSAHLASNQAWKWITRATAEASKSTQKYRLGAVVVSGGSLVSTGFNRRRNNPEYIEPLECGICAEIAAMKKVNPARLAGAVVYVSRLTGGGNLGLSKPCARCQGYMAGVGISRAYYTVSNDEIGMLRIK